MTRNPSANDILEVDRLADVDRAIVALRESPTRGFDQLIARLAAAVLTYCHGDRETVVSATEVFDALRARESRRFLAICLVRIAGERREVFDNLELRIPSVKLFDEVLAQGVYPTFSISVGAQGHEKIDALSDVVPNAIREATAAVRLLNSQPDFTQARTQLMKTLRSRRVAPFISPFVPRDLMESQLEGLLSAVGDVESAEGERLLIAYESAIAAVADFKAAVTAAKTEYSQAIFAPIGEFASERVQRTYTNSGVGLPAVLTVGLSEKKYPLHVTGAQFDLIVNVVNTGPGVALDTIISAEGDKVIHVTTEPVRLGPLVVRDLQLEFEVHVTEGLQPDQGAVVLLTVTWRDASGEHHRLEEAVELPAQSAAVDWDAARTRDPYALEPVTSEDELVGRESILDSLESMMTGPSLGSAVIRGQKRVGKTSIARALESRLRGRGDGSSVVYLEVGPYGADSISATIAALAPQICRAVKRAVNLADLPVPDFSDGSASPLIEFMEQVADIDPGCRIVLVLDEFDELPPALFGAEDLARSFFNTLRAVSNQAHVGILLIGGEKMEFALSIQGDPLNKFREERVDFVDLENNFGDFARLVRNPARSVLEISDEAVSLIHDETVGHPYFTKMVCASIWQQALASRDAHVTPKEVVEAIERTVASAPVTSFQHFWSDGIHGSAQEQATISLKRRRLFIALAEGLRRSKSASEEEVVKEAERFGMSRVEAVTLLQESVRRDVIVQLGHGYVPRIPLFAHWLVEYGPTKIGAQLGSSDVIDALRAREEDLRVTALEIKGVTPRWGTYQGTSVTPEDVRAWLDQFIGPEAQRSMFKILEGLSFYSGPLISEKFEETYAAITRGTRETNRPLSRGDVIVSYLDGAGKSGPEMAKKFRMVNDIAFDNILEIAEMADAISRMSAKTIIFVDDFVATGESVASGISRLVPSVIEFMRSDGIRTGFACVAAFETGLRRIGDVFKEIGVKARVQAGDTLNDRDRCFHPTSRFFDSDDERVAAEVIATRAGEALDKRQPLGFGNAQAAVVFEGRCPNNTLPILWANQGGWKPLFPRH